ncbi:hypothetical protein AQUCO_00700038v1 [Aquilegia coerulea]|uniref:Uncharacterized protein n=1 Tax=Aquilegia coerulea TaxID=218851 RepID=A0A2G5EI78_AQUCA|nr:hypothetical protein AQUCO_00700038v1 [Aquilegia coerulea]
MLETPLDVAKYIVSSIFLQQFRFFSLIQQFRFSSHPNNSSITAFFFFFRFQSLPQSATKNSSARCCVFASWCFQSSLQSRRLMSCTF